MPFFDLHVHPTLKSMLTTRAAKANPWLLLDIKKISWFIRWCTDFKNILGSQCNPAQLIASDCNLVCIALFVPERGITESKLMNRQALKTGLRAYINPERLEEINSGALRPYPDLVKEDLAVLTNPDQFGIHDKEVILLLPGVTYKPEDNSSLYVAFTVEGCHTLSSTLDRNAISHEDVLSNLDDLCREHPVISLNLTHLEQYPFCNHAYGILFVTTDHFKPSGKEISADGIEIIRHCYNRNILIDMKHMSLGARRKLIEDVRLRPDFAALNQPVICSHAGFSGLSYNDIPDYIQYQPVSGKDYSYLLWNKPKKYGTYPTVTAFNPCSINLYDEDIMAILHSGGIIGLSLDKRILGFSDADSRPVAISETTFEEEYISNAELNYFISRKPLGQKMNEHYCITTGEVLAGGVVNPDASFYHLCHFMSHLLHLVKVAGDNGYDVQKALTQVCIGSDFDGFINPVWCCRNVTALQVFKAELIRYFPGYAKNNRDVVSLPEGFNIKVFAEQLFFENGRDFLMNRLSLLNPVIT